MDDGYMNLVYTATISAVYLMVRFFLFRIVDRTIRIRLFHESRGRVIKRVIGISTAAICVSGLFLVWGIERSDLSLFVGSALTIVGVAFFAQWSLLSNITSSILLFFNHPVKLADDIAILEAKDYIIHGRISDIGLFFVTIHTPTGENLVLPNNIFIAKTIQINGQGAACGSNSDMDSLGGSQQG